MSEHLNETFLQELQAIMEDEFPSLLETFLRESAAQFSRVTADWAAQDLDALRRSAHSLKGSCANVGAERLQQSCAELEVKARDEATDGIPQLLELVDAELREVAGELTRRM